MNALCRWPAKISLAGVQSGDSWLVMVVKWPVHRFWLCLDMSRQEGSSWHGFAICHPVMDVRPGLSLSSWAGTAISPPREMFEHLSPTPMLFANKKMGFNYQTEPPEFHSTKTLKVLELVDLNHNFIPLYLSDSTCRAEGGKSSFFPKQGSSPGRPQGSRTWHRLAHTGDRKEGRGKEAWWDQVIAQAGKAG